MTRRSAIVTLACVGSLALCLAADASGRRKDASGGIAGASCTCAADFNGSGQIEAGDLAILLGAWGGAGGDLDGNGTTDAADLAVLLGAWGPCGAPANDECVNALPIGNADAVSFCNVNATSAGQSFAAGVCEGSGATTMGHDVWFEYNAEGDGTVTFSTCGSADFDTMIAVYTTTVPVGSSCPPVSGVSLVTLVGCCDDSDSCGVNSIQSKLSVDVVAGKSYMVRVGGYSNSVGSGTLTTSFKSVGSQCFNGILVEGHDGQTVTVTGTTVDNPMFSPPCVNDSSHGEWITYIPSCQEEHVLLSTCHAGTNYDTVLAVWKETLSGGCDGQLLACEDDTIAAACQINGLNRKTKADFYANAGSIYHILVGGFNGAAAGNYELTIETDCVFP